MIIDGCSIVTMLAWLIAGEAIGEPLAGKLAVGCVVRNRVESIYYPDTWIEVILQKRSGRYQFSCWDNWDRMEKLIKNLPSDIVWIAKGIYHGYLKDNTYGATCFVNRRLAGKLAWMKGMKKVTEIGNHTFYKERSAK